MCVNGNIEQINHFIINSIIFIVLKNIQSSLIQDFGQTDQNFINILIATSCFYAPTKLYTDLHNLRIPQDNLGGTSLKSLLLEAHLKKKETEDCAYDELLNKIGITELEYVWGSKKNASRC